MLLSGSSSRTVYLDPGDGCDGNPTGRQRKRLQDRLKKQESCYRLKKPVFFSAKTGKTAFPDT
jgi:hypothetical protein